MKKIIRLTESELHRLIEGTVKNILKEGGNLATYDDNGKLTYTNSTETWRGVPGTKYIWHGEWSDPEIWYDGELYNANEVEDSLWYSYTEYCEEVNEEPTEDGFKKWVKSENLLNYLY